MEISTFNIQSRSGYNLACYNWQYNIKPKAVVLLIHGFGEHSLRYSPYFELLAKHNINFTGFDLFGHGHSAGKRGTIISYNALLNDIDLLVAKTKQLYPNVPLFIYGHSLGGNLALNYLLNNNPDINGAVVTSPWLKLTADPNIVVKKFVALMQLIAPNVTVNAGLNVNHISTLHPETVKYKSDPLVHGSISLGFLYQIINKGIYAINNGYKIKIPVLLLHGTTDLITSPLCSVKLAQSNNQNITFISFLNAYHELHNDFCRNNLVVTVNNWVSSQIGL